MTKSQHILNLFCSAFIALGVLSTTPSLQADDPTEKPADPTDEPAAAPETGTTTKEIDALIKQLGEGDFKTREKAEHRLKQIGHPALVALQKAKASNDPEVVTRASAIIEKITRKVTLFQRPRANNGGALGQRVQVSVFNEVRTTEVFDGDLTIRITESPRGIDMSITGIEEGKSVTDRVQAATVKELQQKDPDAFRVYSRWVGTGGNDLPPGIFPPGVFPPGVRPPGMGGPIIIRPGFQPAAPVGDDLTALRQRLDQQMTAAGLPEEKQAAVIEKLNQLVDLKLRAAAGLDLKPDEKEIRAYNDKCDELRQVISDLKLPDPGDALPPPAKSRLGVSLGAETVNGVVVTRILPDSRGEKLGLKERDVITSVNGERVHSARDIRKILTSSNKPPVLDVMRDGNETKLEEKTPVPPAEKKEEGR